MRGPNHPMFYWKKTKIGIELSIKYVMNLLKKPPSKPRNLLNYTRMNLNLEKKEFMRST